jgi:biotin carboxyl carrier protein
VSGEWKSSATHHPLFATDDSLFASSVVVAIAVAVGQEVKAGETLAVVEAMKMENVLRAERDGVVKAIHAKKGDSLAVDAVILEFE